MISRTDGGADFQEGVPSADRAIRGFRSRLCLESEIHQQ
ncbi:hypothetical protein T261_01311 [Streptomyces lydicus]|nr:hypothetical protein T261_01311 [Streptomyces lydicus]